MLSSNRTAFFVRLCICMNEKKFHTRKTAIPASHTYKKICQIFSQSELFPAFVTKKSPVASDFIRSVCFSFPDVCFSFMVVLPADTSDNCSFSATTVDCPDTGINSSKRNILIGEEMDTGNTKRTATKSHKKYKYFL